MSEQIDLTQRVEAVEQAMREALERISAEHEELVTLRERTRTLGLVMANIGTIMASVGTMLYGLAGEETAELVADAARRLATATSEQPD